MLHLSKKICLCSGVEKEIIFINKERKDIRLYKEVKSKGSEWLVGVLKRFHEDIIEILYKAEFTEFLRRILYNKI